MFSPYWLTFIVPGDITIIGEDGGERKAANSFFRIG